MSVYIRQEDKKSGIYSWRVQFQGRRLSGKTGTTSEREAKKVEQEKLAELKASWDADQKRFSANMLLADVFCEFDEQIVQKNRAHKKNYEWSMAWLIRFFGKNCRISDITDKRVKEMVA